MFGSVPIAMSAAKKKKKKLTTEGVFVLRTLNTGSAELGSTEGGFA